MKLEFEIQVVFEKAVRKSPHLIAEMLNKEGDFKLTETLTLNGSGIKSFSIARALDDDGNPRFDIFVFQLKDKSQRSNFKVGQIVKLIE